MSSLENFGIASIIFSKMKSLFSIEFEMSVELPDEVLERLFVVMLTPDGNELAIFDGNSDIFGAFFDQPSILESTINSALNAESIVPGLKFDAILTSGRGTVHVVAA